MSQRSNTIKAAGLYTYLSELNAPEGSQVIADNINIDELGVISKRRGFNDYGAALPDSEFRIKQILEYKDRIIRHYDSVLEFDDGSGTFSSFSGSYNEVESEFRIKSKEVNLYPNNILYATFDWGGRNPEELGNVFAVRSIAFGAPESTIYPESVVNWLALVAEIFLIPSEDVK